MYKLFIFTLFSLSSIVLLASAPDSTKSIFEKGSDALKTQKLNGLINSGDYDAAYTYALSLHNSDPHNPFLNYKLGECLYYLKKNSDAKTYLERAENLSNNKLIHKEFKLIYAKVLQRNGEFEKAKEQINSFKNSLKQNDQYFLDEATQVISEIEFAQNQINNPVNVTVSNLGDGINSKFDEYGPTISSDGKTIFFTSRRPETKGGAKDPYDSKFLEDIYFSTWNDQLNTWNKAEPIPGKVNTEDHDGCLSLSPTGDELFIYRNEGDAGVGAGDIFLSKKSPAGKWSVAKRIEKPINSSYFESSASITRDGSKLYFISEREKGLGRGDIYVSERIDKTTWGAPVNLGPIINTKNDERMVYIHPEGDVLFFSSNGHKSIGGYDIYKSTLVDGKWTEPINIGYPINTVDDEVNFTMTANNKKAYITAYLNEGMGGLDIYEVDLTQYPLVSSSSKVIQLKGIITDEDGKNQFGCTVQLKDLTKNQILQEVKTDNNGAFQFFIKPGISYRYIVSKSGYLTTESSDIIATDSDEYLQKDFILKRK